MNKAITNAVQLVKAAVAEMQAQGMSEAAIVADLPRLATAAVQFLAEKARA